ncbi:DUF5980 family protein [Saccharothrix texasensis]|uniref:Uncharacterized protein n=1 Tax=Saccharothrix texasensis TaxID=103734 RepID=A0A3N1HHY8_9PSEU|nr:DUF5980 family protein [Saccharothrix texasensis]ROP42095.1 hypothetical protein EDD40_7588 [Saccharothrix texasensis]
MTSTSRIVRSALALVAVLLLPLVGPLGVASAETTAQDQTWQLEEWDRPQRMCVQHGTDDRVHRSYFIFAVTGDWSTNLDYGMRDLPPGWTSTESVLPPGSNHPDPDDGGVTINGWLLVGGPVSVPMGVYDAQIRVSDGTVTESTPVEIVVTTASWLDCMQARG